MSDDEALLNARQARALTHSLAARGVRRVVVSPGSRSTPLVLAWAACPGVEVTTILDERVAGFVALGLARASGSPVALVCSSGTASAHYLPAVIEASLSRVAIIVMSADRPPELHDCGALQSTDQSHLFGRHVRAFVDLTPPVPETSALPWLGQVAARLCDAARRVPGGPVHVNVPFREPLWTPAVEARLRDDSDVPAPPDVVRSEPMLSAEALARIATRLSRARRGVIVCGPMAPETAAGVRSAAAEIGNLALALGWPTFAEPTSQARFSRTHHGLVVASADMLLRVPSFVAENLPDLILRFGQTPTSKATQAWLAQVGHGRTVLVDEAGDWYDPGCVADTLVVAEPAALCRALAAVVRLAEPDLGWLPAWQRHEAAAQKALAPPCAEGFWEGGLARVVARQLADGTAIHVANSMPIRDLDAFAPVIDRDVRVYANRGASGIDGTLATAAGEALADPARLHVVLLGDLAFLHDLGALRAAVQLGVTLVVVLVDNAGGGIFSFLPIAAHPTAFSEHFRAAQTADLQALACAAGATWQSAATYETLATAIATATAPGRRAAGVQVIAAKIDVEHNVQQHRRAMAAVQQAVEALG